MFVNVVAASGDQAASGFDPTTLLLLAVFAIFIFMMFRKQKKTKKAVQEQRTQMVPGTEVMTQFGLFGTILSVDQAQNRAVLEISPGNTATVHLQTLTKVVQPAPGGPVPDDASSLTDAADRSAAERSGAYRSAGEKAETPEETIARLDEENRNRDN